MGRLECVFRQMVPICSECGICSSNASPEPLNIAEHFHGFCNNGIAIIADTFVVIWCHLAVEPTGIQDLDSIGEPVYTHGSIGSFICTMYHRVKGKFTDSKERVVRTIFVAETGSRSTCRMDLEWQQIIELQQLRQQITCDPLFILHCIAEGFSFEANELDVSAG